MSWSYILRHICLSVMTCFSYSSSLHCKCKAILLINGPNVSIFCIWSFSQCLFSVFISNFIFICLEFVNNNWFTKFLLSVLCRIWFSIMKLYVKVIGFNKFDWGQRSLYKFSLEMNKKKSLKLIKVSVTITLGFPQYVKNHQSLLKCPDV